MASSTNNSFNNNKYKPSNKCLIFTYTNAAGAENCIDIITMRYPSCSAFNFKMEFLCTSHRDCLYATIKQDAFVCIFTFKFNIGYTTMYEKFGKYIFEQCSSMHFQNIEDAGHYMLHLESEDIVNEFKQSIIKFLTLIHKNEIGSINITEEIKKEQERKQFGYGKSTDDLHAPKKCKWA